MPAEADLQRIVDQVRQRLADAEVSGVHLRLAGHRFDDGCLYRVVAPTRGGDRASTHAHLMTQIERELDRAGFADVLLVPGVPEHAGLIGAANGPAGPR